MDSAALIAELLPWHQAVSTSAWLVIATLISLCFLNFVLPARGWLRRLIGRVSLRGSLISGLSIVATVPVLALGVMLAERSANARLDRIAVRAEDQTAAISASVNHFIDKHATGMTSASTAISSVGRAHDMAMQDWLLAYHRIYTDFLTMLHAGPNGDILAATSNMMGPLRPLPDLHGFNVSDRPYFYQPMRDGLTFVSKVFRGRDFGNDPIVAISAPVWDAQGRIAGIIEGSLDLKSFGHIYAEVLDLGDTEIILTDQDHRVIYASESTSLGSLVTFGADPVVDSASRSEALQAFYYSAETYDGNSHYLGVAAATSPGWTVYLRVPLEGVLAQMAADYRSALWIAVIAWALAAVLGWAIVRRVTHSLVDMNAAIERIQIEQAVEGARTPDSAFSEFRPVFRHMRRRARQLQKAYDRLKFSIATGQKLRSELNDAIVSKEAEIADRTAHLEEANQRLTDLSRVDALTGIANRGRFDSFADRVWRIVARESVDAAIILIDIDYFKQYNDTLGHQAGDDCLRKVAKTLKVGANRPLDLVARYGGEEFIIVLGNTPLENALIVAERMRQAIFDLGIPHPASDHGSVSVSVGVAATKSSRDADLAGTIEAADKALYFAKQSGRNRVAANAVDLLTVYEANPADLTDTNVYSILSAKKL